MKRLLLSVAVTAIFAGSAFAADLPAKALPMAPAPVPYAASWTGCYVGAGGGYGMWNQDVTTVFANGATSATITGGGRGWFGTVQGGCDYQFADRWVLGAFADFDWSGLKGTMTWPRGAAGAFPGTIVGEEKHRWSWAVGGRIGYLVLPQLLAYVAGGYTEAQFDEINPLTFALGGAVSTAFLPSQRYKGWFLGTGYEYGISFLPGLFWNNEYRFADYRTESVPFILTANGVPTGDSLSSHKYIQTIRSELVWRFNFGGPVVARY